MDVLYKCPQCEYASPRKFDRDRHVRTHSQPESRIFKCSEEDCGMTFNQRQLLLNHLSNKHKKSPRFVCKICGAVLETSDKRNKHMIAVHGHKPRSTPRLYAVTATGRAASGQFSANEPRKKRRVHTLDSNAAPPTPRDNTENVDPNHRASPRFVQGSSRDGAPQRGHIDPPAAPFNSLPPPRPSAPTSNSPVTLEVPVARILRDKPPSKADESVTTVPQEHNNPSLAQPNRQALGPVAPSRVWCYCHLGAPHDFDRHKCPCACVFLSVNETYQLWLWSAGIGVVPRFAQPREWTSLATTQEWATGSNVTLASGAAETFNENTMGRMDSASVVCNAQVGVTNPYNGTAGTGPQQAYGFLP